jgi:hypothetical protein
MLYQQRQNDGQDNARLVQTILFKADWKKKEAETIVLGYEKGSIEPGETDSWQDMALQIPALPPSDLPHCNNIKIKYHIEVRYIKSNLSKYKVSFKVSS